MKATLPDGTILEGTPTEVADVMRLVVAKPPETVHVPFVAIGPSAPGAMPSSVTINTAMRGCPECTGRAIWMVGPFTCNACGTRYDNTASVYWFNPIETQWSDHLTIANGVRGLGGPH